MTKTLVAGFGNPLRGDDGFGVRVIARLEREQLGADVALIDVGTGGIHLAHERLSQYDRAVVVDAMVRGQPPGTVYVLEVLDVEPESRIDMHLAVPARALGVAKALGVLPASVIMVGCEPQVVDELTLELSAPVAAAVEEAARRILRLLAAESSSA